MNTTSGFLKQCLLVCLLLFPMVLHAQEQMELPHGRKKLKIDTLPFCQVEVLDNRFDTVRLVTYTNALGGFSYKKLSPSLPAAFTSWITAETAHIPHKAGKILMNVKELRTLNGDSRLNAKLDIYWAVGKNQYAYWFSIHLYYENIMVNVENAITDMLKNLLKKAGKESLPVGGTLLSRELINISALARWQQLPVMKDSLPANGEFLRNAHFYNNDKTALTHLLQYNAKDSTWHTAKRSGHLYPEVIIQNRQYYYLYRQNVYLRMQKIETGFMVYIPYAFPDIYTTMAIDAAGRKNKDNDLTSHVGNNGLLAFAVAVFIDGFISIFHHPYSDKVKEIKAMAASHNYRVCVYDMESGELMY
ncbi:hypothetical protein SAMN05421788_102232 [Filimonas lacunae]|uniref:Uncharacterized protein n=1 Tax=Filimonas lacunae TaxID=477680 RepID=A0A173MI95_9BACT|nr:hypothetical protein [Filimonas lacunae]BAV07141.1 hypothetical protein FLA_3164 [Filimonas lacunae]SIS94421.1 hypothetical protein SAMN05421788_102232 [Filimonas lacunae]